ncbi:hypothetical protein V6x_28350 [Gimesia chilikensis]|uniref:Uncharacterized protein n=1 Tax=Gimesia chilikensis TaxID=2605989 RepID=A0A517WCY7_9PLAN|nr:hypothetical protein [Gimesia chilikensis]QDU03123.1 hypothetical protein V6x_28350 [Gimesia chilikensis]
MIGRKKPVQILLDIDDHWCLSRYAAKQKISIRQIVRDQLSPLIDDLKKQYPRTPIDKTGKIGSEKQNDPGSP